jgi:glycosyltransferase involved in cell wall biosynthesis
MGKIIGIDCRFAAQHAGLGRYTRELVTELCAQNDSNVTYVLFVRDPKESWLDSIRGRVRLVTADIPHYSFSEQWRLPLLYRKSGIDLLFVPHFNAPFWCPVPFVVTIHDLILHRHPNAATMSRRFAYRIVLKRAVTKARAIIAVSNFTAKELAYVYGKPVAKKTTVIAEGVHERFVPVSPQLVERVRSRYRLPEQFFLYVGNAKEHKNVQMLLDAFASIRGDGRGLVLVTGGKEADQLSLPRDAMILKDIDDADLPALYTAASVFVTASLYEGFGLPVAEAQACGCPVIAVHRSAIPEIAGNDTVLVEPTVEAISAAMAKSTGARASLPARLQWEDAAAKTLSLLKEQLR